MIRESIMELSEYISAVMTPELAMELAEAREEYRRERQMSSSEVALERLRNRATTEVAREFFEWLLEHRYASERDIEVHLIRVGAASYIREAQRVAARVRRIQS